MSAPRRVRGAAGAAPAIGAALAAALTALPVAAQQAGAAAQLGLRADGADLPDLGRVVLVLALMLALAVAAIYGLRRFLPQAAALRRPGSPVRVAGQLAVSSSLKLHFVELGHATLVVAEGRGGVAIAQLERTAAAAPAVDGAGSAA